MRVVIGKAPPAGLAFFTPRSALDKWEPEGVPTGDFFIQVRDFKSDVVESLAVLIHVIGINCGAFQGQDPLIRDTAVPLPTEFGVELPRLIVITEIP